VRSTTQRTVPSARSSSVPLAGSKASMPRMPKSTVLLIEVYALSATAASGRNFGAPGLPRIGGMASISGMRKRPSCSFAPEIAHASGMPARSVTR